MSNRAGYVQQNLFRPNAETTDETPISTGILDFNHQGIASGRQLKGQKFHSLQESINPGPRST